MKNIFIYFTIILLTILFTLYLYTSYYNIEPFFDKIPPEQFDKLNEYMETDASNITQNLISNRDSFANLTQFLEVINDFGIIKSTIGNQLHDSSMNYHNWLNDNSSYIKSDINDKFVNDINSSIKKYHHEVLHDTSNNNTNTSNNNTNTANNNSKASNKTVINIEIPGVQLSDGAIPQLKKYMTNYITNNHSDNNFNYLTQVPCMATTYKDQFKPISGV